MQHYPSTSFGTYSHVHCILGEDPVRPAGPLQPRFEAGQCRALLQGERASAYLLTSF